MMGEKERERASVHLSHAISRRRSATCRPQANQQILIPCLFFCISFLIDDERLLFSSPGRWTIGNCERTISWQNGKGDQADDFANTWGSFACDFRFVSFDIKLFYYILTPFELRDFPHIREIFLRWFLWGWLGKNFKDFGNFF